MWLRISMMILKIRGEPSDIVGFRIHKRFGDTILTTTITGDYTCSLPGPRHGHSALSFTVLGKMLSYAIFGGEASDLVPASTSATSILSNDVHTLYFTPTTATWIKLWTSCDDSGYGNEPVCPPKRRDAAC